MESMEVNTMPEKPLEKTKEPKELYAFKPLVFTEINEEYDVKPKTPKIHRINQRIVCDERNLYAFGGFLETVTKTVGSHNGYPLSVRRVKIEQLYKFNFCRQQWKTQVTSGQFPDSVLVTSTANLHGNHLVIFGCPPGIIGVIKPSSVDICNLRTNTWSKLSTQGQGPFRLFGHSSLLDEVNKCLYVVGGTDDKINSSDVYKLDLTTGKWEALFLSTGNPSETNEPKKHRPEIAFDGTLIYIIGGGNEHARVNSFESLPVFNIHTRTWSRKDTISDDRHLNLVPASRMSHGCVQIKENVWMSGGETVFEFFDDLWNLFLPTMKWSKVATRIPVGLARHSVSITPQGCMYIFGGVSSHEMLTSVTERTNSLFKIWLMIPSLTELCLEALCHYNAYSIKTLPQNEIIDKGIPREFAERIHN